MLVVIGRRLKINHSLRWYPELAVEFQCRVIYKIYLRWLRMFVNLRKIFVIGVSVAIVSACATTDSEYISMVRGVPLGAQSCCENVFSVLQKATPLTAGAAELSEVGEHFDFGFGIAPIKAYKLDGSSRLIEVKVPRHVKGYVFGGDGTRRHVDVQVLFFDGMGSRMKSAPAKKIVRLTPSGYYYLFCYSEVPDGANFAIVTTDPRNNGKLELSLLEDSVTVLPVAGFQVFIPAGSVTEYTLSSYGKFEIRSLGSVLDGAVK